MVVKEKRKGWDGSVCLECGHTKDEHTLNGCRLCGCKNIYAPIFLPSMERHPHQRKFVESEKKRIIVRAGRRSGKTVGMAIRNVKRFLNGRRQLYATPTSEQLQAWWYEVTKALDPLVQLGVFKKNETEHYIELPRTRQRIKGKTAWNVNTLRGDYVDDLTLDEYQLMDEDVWGVVGEPMLADNDGDAAFIYTPPSLASSGVTKARDPRHAAKLFKAAEKDPGWLALHFTSFDNPYVSHEALSRMAASMSKKSYRQEILAEDDELQLSWLVYRAFNEKACLIDDFEIPKEWPVYVGHDFGRANPAALFVAQNPGTGDFYEFAEYLPGAGHSPFEHSEEFKRITEGYNVIWRSGGSHQEEDSRQLYNEHNWVIMEPKINSVKAQVDKVIGTMERNKIFIFKSLVNRYNEIVNCLWKPDESGKPSDEILNEAQYHLCACARYLYSNFTPETVDFGKSRTRRPSFSFG